MPLPFNNLFVIICVYTVVRFPTDAIRRKQWAVKLRRVDTRTGRLWQPGSSAVLCSKHFNDDDFYYQWGRKLVKRDAVPSIFSFVIPAKRRKVPANRK